MLAASYAKINLFLEVTGKLPNNYHQVNTVLCSIDLCDFIRYTSRSDKAIKVTCSIPELSGNHNLVYKVAEYLQTTYKANQGISIHIDKHIPIAAGLGGGSSNAANCIKALNNLWQLNLDTIELHSAAAMFGSDINFFLEGGTARGENRGEQITPIPHIAIDNILLVNPHIAIPSFLAYRLLSLPNPNEQKSFDPHQLPQTCFNRLESGIRKEFPAIDTLINTIAGYKAEIAMMSGSGSTCFGVFSDTAALHECRDYCNSLGYWSHVCSTHPKDF